MHTVYWTHHRQVMATCGCLFERALGMLLPLISCSPLSMGTLEVSTLQVGKGSIGATPDKRFTRYVKDSRDNLDRRNQACYPRGVNFGEHGSSLRYAA